MHWRSVIAMLLLSLPLAAEPDEQALQWLRKAQEAAGGVERLEAVQAVELQRNVRTSSVLRGLNGVQTVQYVLPDTLKQINELDIGRLVTFVSGDEGWINGPQGRMKMPPPQLR